MCENICSPPITPVIPALCRKQCFNVCLSTEATWYLMKFTWISLPETHWASFIMFHVHVFSFKLFVDILYWLSYYFALLIYMSSLKSPEINPSFVIWVADMCPRSVFLCFSSSVPGKNSKFLFCCMYLSFLLQLLDF